MTNNDIQSQHLTPVRSFEVNANVQSVSSSTYDPDYCDQSKDGEPEVTFDVNIPSKVPFPPRPGDPTRYMLLMGCR